MTLAMNQKERGEEKKEWLERIALRRTFEIGSSNVTKWSLLHISVESSTEGQHKQKTYSNKTNHFNRSR